MSRVVILSMALGGAMALSGCQMAAPDGGASRASGGFEVMGGGSRVIERDVEAPSVFSLEEPGLWDGRPSLGGVWVAHPTARDPERVLIRNGQTGETVIGALFRRERENPGPRFQISSEAANALGILAGAPTTIAVTALRLERIEMEPEPQPQARAELQAQTQVPGGDATVQQVALQASTAATVAPVGAVAETVAISAVDPEPAPRRGLFSGLFRRSEQAAEAPNITETPLVETALAETPGEAAIAELSAPAAEPEPRGRGLFGGLFSRRAAPAEPDANESALIPLPEPALPQTQTASLGTPLSATVVQPVTSALERPFVQIGIFSIETNAQNAQRQMREAGLDAEIRRGRLNDREFWRVVVGPSMDAAARRQVLERVRAVGFTDAYAVVR